MNEESEDFLEIEKAIKVERYRQLNPRAAKGQIVFAGSSLAEQFPVNELLKAAGSSITVYNRGISGDVIQGLLDNIDTLIIDIAPSRLFINIGSNDIGSPDYRRDVLMDKYSRILGIVRNRLPDCKIHILSYYPVNPDKESFIPEAERSEMFRTRSNEAITHANTGLMQLAEDFDAEYIDVSSVLMDEGGRLKAEYTVEGVHLWPEAYRKVLDVLLPWF